MDRRFLRPGWIAGHVLVFLAVLTCLRLGWWQWERTQETTGTAQNFGYALLWPAFGAAFVYMWVRFLHLEVLKDVEDDEQTDRDLRALLEAEGLGEQHPELGPSTDTADDDARQSPATTEAGADDPAGATQDAPARSRRRQGLQRPSQGVTLSVAMVGEDDDDDPELTAYNQVLAALAEEDRRRAR